MLHARILVPALVATSLLVACGSNASSTGSLRGEKLVDEKGRKGFTVDAVDNNFEPPFVTVSVGTTVTFDNTGHNRHNVISVGKGFRSSGLLDAGDTWKVTFDRAGDFRYYCSLHGTPTGGMHGGIRVVG
ncbi:MAG: cupredoxin domain-containing protein [Acidimicrobiia bacterium]